MANRLSENFDWKILLLEVGDEETDFLTDVPLTAAVTVLTSMCQFECTKCVIFVCLLRNCNSKSIIKINTHFKHEIN